CESVLLTFEVEISALAFVAERVQQFVVCHFNSIRVDQSAASSLERSCVGLFSLQGSEPRRTRSSKSVLGHTLAKHPKPHCDLPPRACRQREQPLRLVPPSFSPPVRYRNPTIRAIEWPSRPTQLRR